MQSFTTFCNIFFFYAERFCKLFLFFCSLRNKLMERRIKKSECDRQTVHSNHSFLHVFFNMCEKFIKGLTTFSFICSEDHFSKKKEWSLRSFTIEHVLSAEKTNTLSTIITCNCSIFRCFSICTHTHFAILVNYRHEFLKAWIFSCIHQVNSSGINISFRTVQGKNIALFYNYI